MRYIRDTEKECATVTAVGGKAKNLFALAAMGLPVPKFLVIPKDVLEEVVPMEIQQSPYKTIREYIKRVNISALFIDSCMSHFPNIRYFAVRSSATDEDGDKFSFAGQFESHLFVTKEGLAEKIKDVWCSSFSDRVFEYRIKNKLPHIFGLAVIIQEMVDAHVAGVAFGANPVNNNRSEKLISAVYGLGEGLVSGELNSDNFTLKNGQITATLAEKTHKLILDKEQSGGTRKVPVESKDQKLPSLSDKQINEIGDILDKLTLTYGAPQDIEFAVNKDQVLLLQTRPITTLNRIAKPSGDYILWDNSNIIESYPGVTTPLTFSFISKSYEGAYKLFCSYMGVSDSVITQNERVFANTLGLINGRVYYNLKSWYYMLAMLPGYSINARFMEKMMGVKERFDIPASYQLSKSKAWWSIIRMAVQMYVRFLNLPRKRKMFMELLDTTISQYKKIPYAEKNANELMQLYLDFERILLNEWKAPLINDFFAMIWFGMLQKKCEKYTISKNPNIHNDLLCGSSNIISTQPIHRSIELASRISSDQQLKNLFMYECQNTIWKALNEKKSENFVALKVAIIRYIADFGERCVGELKLETISYSQDPIKFIKILKSYVQTEITVNSTSGKIEEQLRTNAENELEHALKTSYIKKWKLKRTLNRARDLVSARENLRYERTRAFGIVREIFSHIGSRFYEQGSIESARDIFYLTKEEIFSFIEGTAVSQSYKELIQLRKKEFEDYQRQSPPSERFATYGTVYSNNNFFSTNKVQLHEGDLAGIGCCPGVVTAKVRVVLNPEEVSSLAGDILVTSSTDPGWVTLFPSASGIIVERGSLLSHSAIVSREMGKPCIVSVTGLLKTLKTGDEIEMDGGTGKIRIIKKA